MTHLTDEQMRSIVIGAAPQNGQFAHLTECETCMQRYCACLEAEGQLLSPPPAMKEDILSAAAKQKNARPWTLPPVVRFCAAAAAAMALWCSGVFSTLPSLGTRLGQYQQELSTAMWQAEQNAYADQLEQRFNRENEAFEHKQTLPFFKTGGI